MKSKICQCQVGDKVEVELKLLEGGKMTSEHCVKCGRGLKSYPTLNISQLERLVKLIDVSFDKAKEDFKIAESNHDHATAIRLKGTCEAYIHIVWFTDYIKESNYQNKKEISND